MEPLPVDFGSSPELLEGVSNRDSLHDLSPTDLLIATHRLKLAGAVPSALALYRSWIDKNSDHALLYAAVFNYAMMLSSEGDLVAARTALTEAARLQPDFLPAQINLGVILERLGEVGQAVLCWQEITRRLDHINGDSLSQKRITLKQLGRVFTAAHFDPAAESVLKQSLDIAPQQRDVFQHWLSLRQRQCKWPVIVPFGELTRAELLTNMPPLTLATYTDDPLLQMATGASYYKNDVLKQHTNSAYSLPSLNSESVEPIRIGYLSSDLREHAIGYLVAEIFELHDPSVVEVFAYYCGHEVSDDLHLRIRAGAQHWRDIGKMGDDEAAQIISGDDVKILIDLNGYTHGARTGLLALRPAPIIVNWLGYPGTTGSPAHHYIIADEFIIPFGSEMYYSETVCRLPCYQPNDRKRQSSQQAPSRREAGLPEGAMVYCCFNGAHKLTPFTWHRWMAILRQVPDSILWLLEGVQTTNETLVRLAAEHGISSNRLVFAGRRSNAEHLARYQLADLFLDTTPYGAHTTASDALWMGVPIVTLAGRNFASRVCGSLLRAAGIGELVCSTGEQYIALAVELGRNPLKLAELRQKLRAQRDGCVLFDTPQLVSRLEALYQEMWRAARTGQLPRPELSNVQLYGEVGIALDRDDRELLTADYCARYRSELTDRNKPWGACSTL